MQPYSNHTGLVLPFDRVNVDTDQMVPKQFLKLQTKEGYGKVLFYDWRYLPGDKPNPDFILNKPEYRGASILLARAGFGSGSSREHAVWGLQQTGIDAVIAPSYGEIFYFNALNNRLLLVSLPPADIEALVAEVEAASDKQITIDVVGEHVVSPSGRRYAFSIPPRQKQMLLEGLDMIGMTLRQADAIDAFEARHQQVRERLIAWIERMRIDAACLEGFQHCVAGKERDLALAGIAAIEHRRAPELARIADASQPLGLVSERHTHGTPTMRTSGWSATPWTRATVSRTCPMRCSSS